MKVKITEFIAYFAAHAVETSSKAPSSPPAHQEGYSMSAVGEVATVASLERQAKDFQPNDWQSYFNRTRRWLGRRDWDCNGMAEGSYKDKTGVSINTKTRYNCANWCGHKSPTAPDANLTCMA